MVIIDGKGLKVVHAFETPDHGLTRTFQEVRLFDQITVWDNIMVVMTSRPWLPALFERAKPDYKKKAQQILENVGMWHKRRALAMNLSYGQRKLLEMRASHGHGRKGLSLRRALRRPLPPNARTREGDHEADAGPGPTQLSSSPITWDIVRELSDHIFVLDSGTLLAEGEVEDVLNRPEVIEAYLGD